MGKGIQRTEARALPGDAAWWAFLTAEFLTLSIFFVAYSWTRNDQVEVFEIGQATLNPDVGFINTLVLITSGYCAARGVGAVDAGMRKRCSSWFSLAALLGIVFVAIKTWEYVGKFQAGINLSTSDFYFFYFFLTGFHFLHVLLGIGFLLLMAYRSRRPEVSASTARNVASCAAFWHMLDLVWVILFPLLYLA